MKKIKLILLSTVLTAFLASCSTIEPLTATNNSIGSKTGKASNSCLFGFPNGVAAETNLLVTSSGLCFNTKAYGIYEAAKNGGIEKVATVDVKRTWFLIYTKYELIVTGE